MKKKTVLILSPLLILVICQLIPLIWGEALGTRIFIPILITYWVFIFAMIAVYGLKNIKTWLQKPQGHWIWAVILIVLGLTNIPFFLMNISVLAKASLLLPHIVFFLINPWLEEFYWRGVLIDATEHWPKWASVAYSTVLFTAYHTSYAYQAELFRGIPFYAFTFFATVFMAISYIKTKSLWWGMICHILTNILTLSIPVFLNMIEM